MNLNNNIEDLFKSEFENHSITPRPGVWKNIEKQMAIKRFMSFDRSNFNVYYLAAGVLLLISLFFFSNNDENNQSEYNANTLIVEQNTEEKLKQDLPKLNVSESEILENQKNNTFVEEENKNEEVLNTSAKANEAINQTTKNETGDKFKNEIPKTTKKPITDSTETKKLTEDCELKTLGIKVEISETEGCAPLTIYYDIKCLNADSLQVDLGDGTALNDSSLAYTYQKPGMYVIKATAFAESGETKNYFDTITVFENPDPVAIVDADADCEQNCIVYFYNYSQNAVKYSWDFGDENYSYRKDPSHIYSTASNKTIKLTVWSEKMCKDSLILQTPFNREEENKIVFPTAFIPATTGASGGYYSLYSYSTDIFYPVSKGVKEYKLEIYNRYGLLLFQTSDINQGWDGYYKYRLMPQGVYLWKASGKFENNESFELFGDVTLIRK